MGIIPGKITGLVALSDYSALFQNNSDSMFDSVKFGVSVVSKEGFAVFGKEKLHYNYAWTYNIQPETEKEEKEVSEALMEKIGKTAHLEAFIPRYVNQAIIFTGDDMGGDRAMTMTLLYIVIAIMAFVFGITISNTIRKEAGVIGTPSGFRVYQMGTDAALYDHAGSGDDCRSPCGKHSGLYGV